MGYNLSFSVNSYNYCGEMYEENIHLHLNNGTIISFLNIEEYNDFIEQMESLKGEIKTEITHLKCE